MYFTNLDPGLQFNSMARQKKSEDTKQDLETDDPILFSDPSDHNPGQEDSDESLTENEDEKELEEEESKLNQNLDVGELSDPGKSVMPTPEQMPEGMENVSWSDQDSIETEGEDLETGESDKSEEPKSDD
jgi:hypothetical protein